MEPVGDDKNGAGVKMQGDEDESVPLLHHEAIAQVQETVTKLISIDPLLQDLPVGVTLEEINSAIAVEYGQAMVVHVVRADGDVYKVVVVQEATVDQLKHAIKRHVCLRQLRQGGTTHISWKYIWKRHWLYFEGQKLSDNNRTLKSYGIKNRSEVHFIYKLMKEKHPQAVEPS